MIKEADVLKKAALVSDKRAQRVNLHTHKYKNNMGALLLHKEAAAAQKTVDFWSGQYKVADAKMCVLWNVPVLPNVAV